jgi:hypothetical protein
MIPLIVLTIKQGVEERGITSAFSQNEWEEWLAKNVT